jgi:hypothetical protein
MGIPSESPMLTMCVFEVAKSSDNSIVAGLTVTFAGVGNFVFAGLVAIILVFRFRPPSRYANNLLGFQGTIGHKSAFYTLVLRDTTGEYLIIFVGKSQLE